MRGCSCTCEIIGMLHRLASQRLHRVSTLGVPRFWHKQLVLALVIVPLSVCVLCAARLPMLPQPGRGSKISNDTGTNFSDLGHHVGRAAVGGCRKTVDLREGYCLRILACGLFLEPFRRWFFGGLPQEADMDSLEISHAHILLPCQGPSVEAHGPPTGSHLSIGSQLRQGIALVILNTPPPSLAFLTFLWQQCSAYRIAADGGSNRLFDGESNAA